MPLLKSVPRSNPRRTLLVGALAVLLAAIGTVIISGAEAGAGDGFADVQQVLHLGPANTDSAKDNCPGVVNPDQINTDANFVDQTPPINVDDKTYPNSDAAGNDCDTDDDNDGLLDTEEDSGAACGGVITDRLLRDTDLDRVLDGAECNLGSNPTLSSSKPTPPQCGTTADDDGDFLSNRTEVCGYNTSPNNSDTDGDFGNVLKGARDGCEAADVDGDRLVTAGDQFRMVLEILREPNAALRLVSFDVNKDGSVNIGDRFMQVIIQGTVNSCPLS